jgi:hypothetical protein
MTANAPFAAGRPSTLPARSVRVDRAAKARPGSLNIAASTVGTSSHLAAELFKGMARIDMVYVPYKGGGPQVIGLISGETQVAFDTGASLLQHVNAGKLRALAVTSPKRSEQFPDLPTVAATVPVTRRDRPSTYLRLRKHPRRSSTGCTRKSCVFSRGRIRKKNS